jgi:hypothetical protein
MGDSAGSREILFAQIVTHAAREERHGHDDSISGIDASGPKRPCSCGSGRKLGTSTAVAR